MESGHGAVYPDRDPLVPRCYDARGRGAWFDAARWRHESDARHGASEGTRFYPGAGRHPRMGLVEGTRKRHVGARIREMNEAQRTAEAPARRRSPLRRGDEITLTIDRLAYGGRGVGRHDGFVVFVPGTAPGELVRARLWRIKPGYGEADLVEVTGRSPQRTTPPCPHFGPCGGCVWQHLAYPAQAAAKAAIVQESLAHLGSLRDVQVRPIIAAAAPWYYRNKMEFTFHPDGELGLHRRGAWDSIVPIQSCYLQSPASNVIIGIARAWARESGLPRYDPRSHAGVLRQVIIREGKATGEVMVLLVTATPGPGGLRALASRLVDAVPRITSVLHATNPGLSDGLPLSGITTLAGRPYIVEELGGLRFRIGPETFFQTNTAQAERLVEVAAAFSALGGGETVYDLYCGVGTFSLALARRAGRVFGIEIAPQAIEAARGNAALNGIENVEFSSGDVRRLLPHLRTRAGRPDLVLLDPPRSGAGDRVMQQIAATGTPRIVYVSCNPTTLAPDLKELVSAGYAVRAAQPLDLFPHTYHVECVVLLERITPVESG
jgi:23S rRNA (uracil1939-C5)-methyltransferase